MDISSKYIKEELLKISESNYKNFSASLIPECNNMLGVRIPVLRKLAKQIAKEDYLKYIISADTEYFEEIMLLGFVIAYAKCSINERIKYIKDFVPKIDNWSVNDCFCATLKDAKKYQKEYMCLIKKYLYAQNEFEVRFAVIMLMDYFLNDEYIDEVLSLLDTVKHDGYYVKMGIAWAVATSYAKYRNKTLLYLNNNNLDDWTYNKSIQKMKESSRVSNEDKKMLEGMKRKAF